MKEKPKDTSYGEYPLTKEEYVMGFIAMLVGFIWGLLFIFLLSLVVGL